MQLFDDLEDFGAFDDAVSGNVRDPYAELAVRRREGAVQRLDMSGMPHDAAKPVFMVYRYDEIAQMLRDNATFSSSIVTHFFGDSLGKHVMLGMDEPEHRRYRALVSAAFTQKALARRQDELVVPRGRRPDRPLRRTRAAPTSSASSPSRTRRRSSPASSACRRRTSRSSSAGRSRCSPSSSTASAPSRPRRRCATTSRRSSRRGAPTRATI